MFTPKDNMISQIWGLKLQPLTAATVALTADQAGTLFTNEGATGIVEIELPAINTLRQDKFIQPFYFSPVTNKEMTISIKSVPGSDAIVIPDYNNNLTANVVTVSNIEGDGSVYNIGSLIGLYPAKAGRWHIAHITGVWNASGGYGTFDSLGLRNRSPRIILEKNTTQTIGYNTTVTWTDIIWQSIVEKLYFQFGAGTSNITAEMSGLADIYVGLEHLVDADGAGDSTLARVIVNSSEIRNSKNTTPEHQFIDTTNARRHLKLVIPDVSLSINDIIRVQAANNATSGTMTIYNTDNTFIKIKYKR